MDLDLASQLLSYGRPLRKIVANRVFDYSAAQATSTWILESIEGCSSYFFPLVQPAQDYKDAMCLSSGVGITEIWSNLSVYRKSSSSTSSQFLLENTDSIIGNTSSTYGMVLKWNSSLSSKLTSSCFDRASNANFPADGIAYFTQCSDR